MPLDATATSCFPKTFTSLRPSWPAAHVNVHTYLNALINEWHMT